MEKHQLQEIFKNSYNTNAWYQILINVFGATELRREPKSLENEGNENVEGFELGRIIMPDHYEIGLYEFEIKAKHNLAMNRVGLRGLVKGFLKFKVDAALVVYYDQNQWRLSFICDLSDEKTAPKRFTYLFGSDLETYRTPVERFIKLKADGVTFKNIFEAFSVEKLSEDFFSDYKRQYNKFVSHIQDLKENRDYVKKLLGRLVFLQFVQKKGWLGGDQNFLVKLFEKTPHKEDFLDRVLEPLFFDTLNNNNRKGNIAPEVLGEGILIPYLNGGLFERDELDKKAIKFPANFFGELLEFFAQYNFTIDENDPTDAEIGIDPEMLGHIFENLLEDNKDKGAFYTPKEIVQFMSSESLMQYLKSKTEETLHPCLEQLIRHHTVADTLQNCKIANELNTLLKNVKICDPAIGSGAFPMGILNEIFAVRKLLYGHLDNNEVFSPVEIKKEIIQNNIYGVDIEQGAVDIARLRFWLSLVVDEIEPHPLPNLDYKIMCGNSLLSRFSLDTPINEVFIEYNKKHKTNFTLEDYSKLVWDYTIPRSSERKDIFRETIEEIKYAFKTTLKQGDVLKRKKIEAEIYDLDHRDMFGARKANDKRNGEMLKKLQIKLIKMLQEESDILDNKLYENSFEWRFELPCLLDNKGEFIGFDIVIGNPPFRRIQGIRDTNPAFADELVKRYGSATGSFDLYAIFVERALQVINKDNGIVNFIMPVKWTNAAFGKGLRSIVAAERFAYKIINFGAYQVFKASTYTGLQWFKRNSEKLYYYELDRDLNTNQELGLYLNSLDNNIAAKIHPDKLSANPWVLTVGDTTALISNLEKHTRRMKDVFGKIFQGLATSKDDVYFLYKCRTEGNAIIGYSKYLEREIMIERGLVKPLLKGEDVHRYEKISTNRFVVFPYHLGEEKASLYTEKEIAELFPLGYAYLKECEDVLRGREKGKLLNDDFWFRYIYPKNLVLFDNEKLVAPDISLGGNFSFDFSGEFYQTTTIYGYIKKPHIEESYKCLAAILNSRLCWWFLVNTGTTLANGYFRYKPDYINPFPVPKTISPNIIKIIDSLVDYLIYLKDKTKKQVVPHTSNERLIVHFEDIINMVIYELYFGDHMKDNEIDVLKFLAPKAIENLEPDNKNEIIREFYLWYQLSENPIRQRIMLVETRSRTVIHLINKSSLI